ELDAVSNRTDLARQNLSGERLDIEGPLLVGDVHGTVNVLVQRNRDHDLRKGLLIQSAVSAGRTKSELVGGDRQLNTNIDRVVQQTGKVRVERVQPNGTRQDKFVLQHADSRLDNAIRLLKNMSH